MNMCIRIFVQSMLALSWVMSLAISTAYAETAQFAYGINAGDWSVTQYRVNPDTGELRHNGHLPAIKFPAAVAVHPSKKFLLTALKTSAAVAVYRIDAKTGLLTEIPQSPFKTNANSPYSISFHPSGRFVYVAARWGGVVAFAIDEKSGVLTTLPGSPFAAEKRTRSLKVHPSGRFVYASNAHSNSISAYRINQKTGVLTQLSESPFSTGATMVVDPELMKIYDAPPESGGAPYRVEIHPSGRFVFVTNWMGLSLSVLAVNKETGVLTPVKNSPFPVGGGGRPYAVTAHPSGRFVYVSSWDNHKVWGYQFDDVTGQLTALTSSPYSVDGYGPLGIDFNKEGNRAYVTNLESNSITQFSVNGRNGELTFENIMRTRFHPFGLALLETEPVEVAPGFVFITKENDQLWALRSDNESKAQSLSGQEQNKATSPQVPLATAVDPRGRFVFRALNTTDDPYQSGIAVYRIDEKDHRLTYLPEQKFRLGFIPTDLAVDASGRFLYAVNPIYNSLGVFGIDAEKGALSVPDSPAPETGMKPVAVALDPVGRFSFVANSEDNSVSVFTHRRIMTPAMHHVNYTGSTFMTGKNPVALAVDPTGNFLVVANQDSNNLSVFSIHFHKGLLTPVEGSPFLSGAKPVSVAIHPSGKWVYALNTESGDITSYRLEKKSGILKEITQHRISAGKLPTKMVLDSSGNFAYVQNKGRRELRKYSVDSRRGKLSFSGEVDVGPNVTLVP